MAPVAKCEVKCGRNIKKASHHHNSPGHGSLSLSVIHAYDLCCYPLHARALQGFFFLFPAQHSLNTNYRVSLSLLSVLSARTEGASLAVVDANVDHITGGEEEAAMWQPDREPGSFCCEAKI